MSFVHRVVRNVTRRKFRTIGVALIVGLTLGVFLILSTISGGIQNNINAAKAAVQDIVTVEQPSAGGGGPGGGRGPFSSTPLPESAVGVATNTPDVAFVQRILINITVPAGCGSGGGSGGYQCFANATTYEGIDVNTSAGVEMFSGFGAGTSPNIVEGTEMTPQEEDQDVAIVGQSFATTYNLVPGQQNDLFNIGSTQFRCVGVYSTGRFGGNGVIMPFPAASQALGISGPTLLYVTVNNAANVNSVVAELQAEYNGAYEVTPLNSFNGGTFESAIDSVVSSAQFEEYTALAVGAGVMVLVMILVTMNRTREIGLLKAFGFPNRLIFSQLLAESMLWSVIGLPVGLAVSYWLGPFVAQSIAGSAAQSAFGGRSFGGGGGGGFASGFANRLLGSVNFGITWQVLALGALVTLGFGVIGAAYPILRAIRLQPAEALRNE